MPPRPAVVLLVTTAVALGAPAAARAHANLLQTIPPDRAALAVSPPSVRIVFDDRVQVGPANAAVRNGGGSVAAGRARSHGTVLELPLRSNLRPGNYSVRWSAVSDDGHVESGVLAFAIGTAPPPASTFAADQAVGAATVVLRWLFFCGVLIAGGLVLFELAVWRPVSRRPLPLVGLAVALALAAGAALALAYHADARLSTRFGAVLAASAAVAGVGAAAAFGARRDRRLAGVAAAAAIGLLAAPTLAGHALDRGRAWWDAPVDLLHVVAVAFWLGSLAALVVVLPASGTARADSSRAARRFSRLALATVAAIAATGALSAVAALSSVSELRDTSYGRALAVKTALFLAVLMLAAVSRSRVAAGWTRLRASVTAEAVVLLGAVAAVGVLTALAPADAARALASPAGQLAKRPLVRFPPADATVLAQRDGALAAALAVQPSGTATATFLGQDARMVDVGAVTIDGRPAATCGTGCYSGRARPGAVVRVAHGDSTLLFDLTDARPASPALMLHIAAAYAGAHSTRYRQWVETGSGASFHAEWVEVAPHSFSYALSTGSRAVVIGKRRWDLLPGSDWQPSRTVRSSGFVPPWGTEGRLANVHVIRTTPRTMTVAFFGASTTYPAWFTVTVDRRTLRPLSVRMTAAAHFMSSTYYSWNRPLSVEPPSL